MTGQQWTHGPWCVSRYETKTRGLDIIPSGGHSLFIASVYLPRCTDQTRARADARLIAAAPEMLVALERLCEVFAGGHVSEQRNIELAQARAVIARAKGES